MMVEAFDERNIRNWALKKKLLRMTAELCNLLGNRKMHASIVSQIEHKLCSAK